MTRDRYSLTSERGPAGKITHNYSGRLNRNANESEPHKKPFHSMDLSAMEIAGFHEKYLSRRDGVQTITTKIVSKNYNPNLISRLLNYLDCLRAEIRGDVLD